MRLYYWRGRTSSGKRVRGSTQAPDRASVITQLEKRGVISPQLLPLPALQRPPTPTRITLLIRQLATLLESGLTLAHALEGGRAGERHRALKQLCQNMLDELHQGNPLSTVLAVRPQLFDPFLIHLVKAGEQSSQLPQLLQRAATHREQMRTMKRQGWKAISYPLGVLLFTVAISLFLLLQVVPRFESMFQNLGGTLPPLTQQLLLLTHTLQQNLPTLLVVGILSPLLMAIGYRSLPSFRSQVDHGLLKTPLLGSLLREIMVARLGHTLAILHHAAIPLHSGLKSVEDMSRLVPFRQAILTIRQSIQQGDTLSAALRKEPLFPPIAIQMIHAGEESGTLGEMLERLANYYEEETLHRIQQLTTWLEPLLILLIGGMVGTLAIALYQPIFQLGHHL